ncbi:alpha-amylase family protein [Clostridium sp. AM58-1XD]|uniref:alpha-amylase family protein n=1 Tax=Clostridium sp. AM58-1XD TaxID=2292307 RepID=UPI000E4FAFEC|nr:alpha-amylase family protein [Clostridium sp. AM58-1XD]RGZ01274.1 hypothetical protein DXA13_02745 [Clostridium sp. AM58-1XD]
MEKMWYQKQLRMVQTVLREPDIVNYDAKAVTDYLVKSNANCIIVNAGGIVDFFHSGLEGANLNPFMKNEDVLGDLVREAHARDIKVICRIDFRGAEKDFYRSHPDWFACEEDGGPKMMSSTIKSEVDIYTPCYNSRYMNEHAMDFTRSIFRQYDVDGIWENALGIPHGVCRCVRCRTKYRQDMGKDLPAEAQMKIPAVREEYRKWKYQCAKEHIERIKNTVKEFGEDKAYAAEIFGFLRTAEREAVNVLDLDMAKESFDYLVTPAMVSQEAYPAAYDSGLVYTGSIVKHMKMISREKQAVLLFGNNGGTLRYVKDPAAENKIWLWEAVSAGGGFWNCLFNGQHPAATHDNRAAYISKPMFDFLKENEEILEENYPMAEAAIYASKPTRDIFGNTVNSDMDRFCCNMKGVEKILAGKHIQFVHIPGGVSITLEELKPYKVIILPNAACMSDYEVSVFEQYVREGGSVIASYETSLYDENGRKRSDFALGNVFGITNTGTVEDTRVDCYQLIRDRESPLLRGITDTQVLANGEHTILVNELPGANTATTYIPIIRNQPPEKAWIRDMKTVYPVSLINHWGSGKAVYFAFPIGRALYKYAHDDFVQLFENALDAALGDKTMLTTNAPASVHIQMINTGEDQKDIMMSLVNHTGTMYRPVQEVVPVHQIEVKIELPHSPKELRILRAEAPAVFKEKEREDGTVTVTFCLDKLEEFAAIWIRL